MLKVPLVADDAPQAIPDQQVSSVGAEPAPSGQSLVLKIEHRRTDSYGNPIENTVDFALSLRGAAILCRELRGALKQCLLDPLEEEGSHSTEDQNQSYFTSRSHDCQVGGISP